MLEVEGQDDAETSKVCLQAPPSHDEGVIVADLQILPDSNSA